MADRPNLILITSHDTGRHLGCYGAAGAPSPNLDALAARGTRLARAFCTQSQCSPSRASIATGRYPHSHGVMGLCHGRFRWDLHDDEQPIATLLKAAGYRTALCGLQHESPRPEWLGFDVCDFGGLAHAVADKAERHLADLARAAQPFYLQVGFVETHRGGPGMQFHGHPPIPLDDVAVPPWLIDEPAARDEFANLGGAVRALDAAVGRIQDTVDRLDLADRTIVAFTVDHGLPFPRAKTSLYDPGLEVAMMLAGPGVRAGAVRDELISNVDLLPTLMDLLHLPAPDRVQGRSFAPLLTGRGGYAPADAVFAEMTYHNYCDPMRCIRTATHKLTVNFMPTAGFFNCTQQWRPRCKASAQVAEPAGAHPPLELYDLGADPLERRNLADDEASAALRDELLGRLARHLRDTGDPLLSSLPVPVMFTEAQRMLRDAMN